MSADVRRWYGVGMARNHRYAELGRRVADIRKARGLTQELLSERVSVGTSYIARIEGGTRRPTIDVLYEIAKALEVPVWRLLGEERLTPDEERWRDKALDLADAIRGLEPDDLALLTALARRLGGREP
jgi:transcriptional regulator with XRE-family HTH domain